MPTRNALLRCVFALATINTAAQIGSGISTNISSTLKHMQSRDCEQQKGALSHAQDLLASGETDAQQKNLLREGLIQMLSGENARFAKSRNNPKLQNYGRPKACPGGDDESDPESEFYSDLVAEVAQLDDERTIPVLVDAINMQAAEEALMKYGSKALNPVLAQLKNQDEWTRKTALRVSITLLEMHEEPDTRVKIRELIRSALRDPVAIVRSEAIKDISCLSGREEYISMLEEVAKQDPLKLPGKADDGGDGEEFYPIRYYARRALREIKNGENCVR